MISGGAQSNHNRDKLGTAEEGSTGDARAGPIGAGPAILCQAGHRGIVVRGTRLGGLQLLPSRFPPFCLQRSAGLWQFLPSHTPPFLRQSRRGYAFQPLALQASAGTELAVFAKQGARANIGQVPWWVRRPKPG